MRGGWVMICVAAMAAAGWGCSSDGGDDGGGISLVPGGDDTGGAPADTPPSSDGLPPSPAGEAGSGAPVDTPATGVDDEPASPTGGDEGDRPSEATGGPIPAGCEGFELIGLMHSPGGDVLPNTCEPFHATLNNPYAVRCIDAWPWYDTGFPGDDLCILPPPPDKGIQVGFHPMGDAYWSQMENQDLSGYQVDDPQWVMAAGAEETRNYRNAADSGEANSYYRTYFRMRTGSHHNIITLHEAGPEAGWLPSFGDSLPGLFDASAGALEGVLGGQQRPDDNTPVTWNKPPEDEGLYLNWPANPNVLYNLHHFNVTDGDILKEGWVNIWWEDDTQTLVSWFMGLEPSQLLTLSVSPGQTADYHYVFNASTDLRVIRLFGHRHVWTTNFTSWIERSTGETEIVYQSFDWFDMPTYRYDSVVQNPSPNFDLRVDGAPSGVLNLNAGDSLHFNCHMEFTDERAVAENAPMPAELGRVRFANQAYTGEMCIQFGNVSGGWLGLPGVATTPPIPEAM